MDKSKWVNRFLVVFFLVPVVIEGALFESFIGVYLLDDFPIVFHTLNIVALAMFGVCLATVAGEIVYTGIKRR